MNKGYIVWNLSNHDDGYEIFGVYRTYEKAERIYQKIIKARYGNMTEDQILDYETHHGDSIRITPFVDTNGKTYTIQPSSEE